MTPRQEGDLREVFRIARRRARGLLAAAACGLLAAWACGGGARLRVEEHPDPDRYAYRLDFQRVPNYRRLLHAGMSDPGTIRLYENLDPYRMVAESGVVELGRPHPVTWNSETSRDVIVGNAATFRNVPPLSPLSSAPYRKRTLPLDVVADASNRGYRIALPVAWFVLALDVLLVLLALAVPRHRAVAGRMVQPSAWLFGATAWMMGTVSCLFLGGLRWFVAGVLLAGIGVIPLGIYVALVTRPGGGFVESLTAMALATVAAWYAGRRLRR